MLSPWSRRQCAALQTHLQNLLTQPAHQAIYRIVHFMGYGKYAEERGRDLRKAEILEVLGEHEQTPVTLLERLQVLYQQIKNGDGGGNGNIILSTIHSSKGLEYPHVILMDVIDGILPKVSSSDGEEGDDTYQEERRLFYVGMTRAKDTLSVMTFRNEALTSSFARELFPPQVDKPGETLDQGYTITQGCSIRHKKYGTGIVLNRVGDIATVSFSSVGEKKLSVSTAMKNHLIQGSKTGCSD